MQRGAVALMAALEYFRGTTGGTRAHLTTFDFARPLGPLGRL